MIKRLPVHATRLAGALALTALLVVPAAMAAHRPGHPAQNGTFVFRGTVTSFSVPGSIQLTVSGGNALALKSAAKGTTATVATDSATRIVSLGGVASGDNVIVRVQAPRNATAATLAATAAKQVVERAATAPVVTYVVRGTVTSFARDDDGNGSIAVTVTGGNNHARSVFGTSGAQTFTLGTTTEEVSTGGIAPGERVLVKVRAPKGLTSADAATLTGAAAAQVVELGS